MQIILFDVKIKCHNRIPTKAHIFSNYIEVFSFDVN